MPNPYDELFDPDPEQPKRKQSAAPKPPVDPLEAEPEPLAAYSFDPDNYEPGPDALDAVLDMIRNFNEKAEKFSKELSDLGVVDHEVTNKITRVFFISEDPHERGSLKGERRYHEIQLRKFSIIIVPMRELADLHRSTVKLFNSDVDANYFNPEKTELVVKQEKTRATEGINLQRKILADAAGALEILTEGLADTERRVKKYVNAGGQNNISSSEFELLVRKREHITSGREHHFDHKIFDINLIDKTALSLGIYQKETSTQYLSKLGKALDL